MPLIAGFKNDELGNPLLIGVNIQVSKDSVIIQV